MFENEEWLPIERLDHYFISNLGRVKHQNRPDKALKVSINDRGFPIVVLYGKDSKTRNLRQINKLVAEAFLDPPIYPDMIAVWHIDGSFTNCAADNLRWETRGRVLAWNEQQRICAPRFQTGRVFNGHNGETYENAYECAKDIGELEDTIVWKCENNSPWYHYVDGLTL